MSTDIEQSYPNNQLRTESLWDYGTADEFNQTLGMYGAPSSHQVQNQELLTGLLNQTEYTESTKMSPKDADNPNQTLLGSQPAGGNNTTFLATKDDRER